MSKTWYKLLCKKKDLQLLGTLNGGQSFRWKKSTDNNIEEWIGVFAESVWILQQYDDFILYQVYQKPNAPYRNEEYNKNLLFNYFHLDINLDDYYQEWCIKDNFFKEAASQFYGIRILQQDIIENIFSFICSSNNNINRITSMIEKLTMIYGDKICEIRGKIYYTFPRVEELLDDDLESVLKKQGFGYRAKYISESAKIIAKKGTEKWINKLKLLPYEEAKVKLMTLVGIGPKVADCICLMSLGHLQAIPVDTHVYQIARKYYMPDLPKRKSVTTKTYQEIGDNFRNIYGPLAGWAHTVLFCADLKKFQVNNSIVLNTK